MLNHRPMPKEIGSSRKFMVNSYRQNYPDYGGYQYSIETQFYISFVCELRSLYGIIHRIVYVNRTPLTKFHR